jgi:hypothetical protein
MPDLMAESPFECDGLQYDLSGLTLSISGEGSITLDCTSQFRSSPFTSVIVETGVLKIDDAALSDFGALATIHFPDTLLEIGVSAFRYSANLSTITGAANLRSIGAQAFSSCPSLSTFELPDPIETIGSNAFSGARLFSLARLPDSLLTIESSLFIGCSSITELTIGSQLSSITTSVWQPHSLARILVTDANPNYSSDDGAVYSKDGTTLICVPLGHAGTSFRVADHGVIIREWAFHGASRFTFVSMPHVVVIENDVFTTCSGISRVDFGDSLVLVQAEAFRDCSALVFTELPDSLVQIDDLAFRAAGLITALHFGAALADVHGRAFASSLATITISGSNQNLVVDNGLMFTKDRSRLVLFPHGLRLDQFVAPATVRVIADCVLFNCADLVHLSMPSVVDIGAQSFALCQSLKDVTFGDSLAAIGRRAFAEDAALASISFPPSLTVIADSAFCQCRGLSSVIVLGTLDEVAEGAFSYCNQLQSLVIEDGVIALRDWAFGSCVKLSSVSLPNTLRTIGAYALQGSNVLTELWIPDLVTQMGQYAMSSSLIKISMPGDVDMRENPLGYCDKLVEIHLRDTPAQSVCDALAMKPQVAIFISNRSGLTVGDTVCGGRNITIEPAVVTASFRPPRSKLPSQSPSRPKTPFPTASSYLVPRPPTASPVPGDGSDEGGGVPVAAFVVPGVLLVVLVVGGAVFFWRRRSYAKVDEGTKEPLQLHSDDAGLVLSHV